MSLVRRLSCLGYSLGTRSRRWFCQRRMLGAFKPTDAPSSIQAMGATMSRQRTIGFVDAPAARRKGPQLQGQPAEPPQGAPVDRFAQRQDPEMLQPPFFWLAVEQEGEVPPLSSH